MKVLCRERETERERERERDMAEYVSVEEGL